MTTLTAEAVRMPFGHYKDSTLGEIAAADVLYLDHMASENLRDTFLAEAFAVLVEKHAATIAEKKARGERPKLFDGRATQAPAHRPKQLKLL